MKVMLYMIIMIFTILSTSSIIIIDITHTKYSDCLYSPVNVCDGISCSNVSCTPPRNTSEYDGMPENINITNINIEIIFFILSTQISLFI